MLFSLKQSITPVTVMISFKRLLAKVALALAFILAGCGPAGAPKKVLIIQDELPQIEILSRFLVGEGGLEVTTVEQSGLPANLSAFGAVMVFIHGTLEEATELAMINYTRQGGRLIVLHHSISSKKAENELYFDFLGIRLDNPTQSKNPVEPGGGYGWRHADMAIVNLNPSHYITRHNVSWPDTLDYTPSDFPSTEGRYPAIMLQHSEAYMNHKFTDGREKIVLVGLKYYDDRNDQLFMQDRVVWIKPQGDGVIVYILPGHRVEDYENRNVAQMILNAVNWIP